MDEEAEVTCCYREEKSEAGPVANNVPVKGGEGVADSVNSAADITENKLLELSIPIHEESDRAECKTEKAVRNSHGVSAAIHSSYLCKATKSTE